MQPIRHQAGDLYIEDVPVASIAERFGTPTYVYSSLAIEQTLARFSAAFGERDHRVCYAVKANSNLGVLGLLAELGAGFDIVSGGELARVIQAGADPAKVVFSGVGKQPAEMMAALDAGIACFNVESASELKRLNDIAGTLDKVAPVSLRVNPDVDARTHPYISTGLRENKFGVSVRDARQLYKAAAKMPHIAVTGIGCHIGSQITTLEPFTAAAERILRLVDELEAGGIELAHVDFGGGIGIAYQEEPVVDIETYAAAILQATGKRSQSLWFEPGRYIVGEAGILVARVLTLKENEGKRFAVIDAAMNDLLRPALYNAWQRVSEVHQRDGARLSYDIVGPVCETGDFLAKGRSLCLAEGDLVAVHDAGAYGFVMSSNYNSRNRPAEVMVAGSDAQCVRERESIDDQLRLEHKFKR